MGGSIVAMGGGGFSMEPENPLLDDFVLSLTGLRRPRVCFLPTASGDAEAYIERFHQAFPAARAQASHLALFRRDGRDLREFVLSQDAIYVGGGSTANLLALWRLHGLDEILREAHDAGVVLAGISAGALCWFEGGITDSFGPLRYLWDGMDLLPGTFCPHYDGEEDRRPAFQAAISNGVPSGLAADDGAAVHFNDGRLVDAVASRPSATVYRLERCKGRTLETSLPTRLLS